MELSAIRPEMTPNPNAWKFVLPLDVIGAGGATFRSPADAERFPLAYALIRIGHVTQVYFFRNVITVTQDGEIDWGILADVVRRKIADHADEHDPAAVKADGRPLDLEQESSEKLRHISAIIDNTIRPALQDDGGDLHILGYDAATHVLRIAYQGACGSCPSSTAGTMYAIQSMLQESVDPLIRVIPA